MNDIIKRLVLDVVSLYVTKPGDLKVEVIQNGFTVNVRIKPAPEDIGRVIGTRGLRFKSVRDMLTMFGERTGRVINLMRISDYGSSPQVAVGVNRPESEWPAKEFREIARRIAGAMLKDSGVIYVDMQGDNGSVVLRVHVGTGESMRDVRMTYDVLGVLIPAGAARYSKIVVPLIVPDIEPQPDSADGRHAKAIKR